MRFLHRTGRVRVDLAPRITGPVLYAYESIPSALTAEQISAVLKCTRKDRSPMGYRDYAILLLLSTYGLRDGEIKRLLAPGLATLWTAGGGSSWPRYPHGRYRYR